MRPYLLQFGHLTLPTYGALAALGLMLGLWFSQRTARLAGVDPERLWNAGLFTVAAAFVASRVLLAAMHFADFQRYPVLLLAVPSLTPAGLLLATVATLIWLRWQRLDVLRVFDAWAPCALVVWALLALGHFAEGSDAGMTSRFGLRMPGDAVATHPVALYAAALAAVLAGLAYRWLGRKQQAGQTAGLALCGAGVGQFLLSFLRQPGDDAGRGLDALQGVALAMVTTGGLLACMGVRTSGRKPS